MEVPESVKKAGSAIADAAKDLSHKTSEGVKNAAQSTKEGFHSKMRENIFRKELYMPLKASRKVPKILEIK